MSVVLKRFSFSPDIHIRPTDVSPLKPLTKLYQSIAYKQKFTVIRESTTTFTKFEV